MRRHALAILSTVATAVSAAALEPFPDKLVVLNFDDCNQSDRASVADVLKKHGFGATCYVTEGLGFLGNKRHYTTWREIKEIADMGFEIGNHKTQLVRIRIPSLPISKFEIDVLSEEDQEFVRKGSDGRSCGQILTRLNLILSCGLVSDEPEPPEQIRATRPNDRFRAPRKEP